MGRPPKWAAGLGPLREYWLAINRAEREAKAQKRVEQKARDKRRPKCRCKAYPWPHRPAGGLCRYPDPPVETWKPKVEWKYRPHRERYTGLRRQIARANGLHPIKDREKITDLVSEARRLAKQAKTKMPRMRYREVEITENGVRVHLPSSGPDWDRTAYPWR
jgi:hypothetical protein